MPAAPRTIVGRAYYGLFNLLAAFLRNYISIRDDASGHKDVADALKQCTDNQIYEMGSFLEDLRAARNKADYKMHLRDLDSMPNAKWWFGEARTCADDVIARFTGQAGVAALKLVQTDWQAWKNKLTPKTGN